jgi:hypothetical protein
MRRIVLVGLMALLIGGCATSESTPTPFPTATNTLDLYRAANPEDEDFCPPPNGWFEYIIRPGDTIQSLARQTNSNVGELATANCLNNPRTITVGTRFYVPQRLN